MGGNPLGRSEIAQERLGSRCITGTDQCLREPELHERAVSVIEATGGAMNAPQAGGPNQMRGRGPRMF